MKILVKEINYELQAIKRNCGAHFACSIFIDNKWIYIDDLNIYKIFYQDINEMFSENIGGWFVAFYRKASEFIDFVIDIETIQESNFNDEKTDKAIPNNVPKKEYPNRKRNVINYEGLFSKSNKKIKLDNLFQSIDKKVKNFKRRVNYEPAKRKAY